MKLKYVHVSYIPHQDIDFKKLVFYIFYKKLKNNEINTHTKNPQKKPLNK